MQNRRELRTEGTEPTLQVSSGSLLSALRFLLFMFNRGSSFYRLDEFGRHIVDIDWSEEMEVVHSSSPAQRLHDSIHSLGSIVGTGDEERLSILTEGEFRQTLSGVDIAEQQGRG